MNRDPLTVLKFGSSVLSEPSQYTFAAQEVYRWVKHGHRVIVVVSAMGNETDKLLQLAAQIHSDADDYLIAALAATGEATSAARFGLALDLAGIPAHTLDPATINLQTSDDPLDARLIDVNVPRINQALSHCPVLVLQGFSGKNSLGHTTLLGRGGSDLTALFIANRMSADHCVLIKDVRGLYDRDPSQFRDQAKLYSRASYDEVLALDESIIQHKAVRFAKQHHLSFRVSCVGGHGGTLISNQSCLFAEDSNGQGCKQIFSIGQKACLASLGPLLEQFSFEVIGHLEIDRVDPQRKGSAVPGSNPYWDLLFDKADILIDLCARGVSALPWIENALTRGKRVITANLKLIADQFSHLHSLQQYPEQLLFNSAIGGALPILEVLRNAMGSGQLRALEGIHHQTSGTHPPSLRASSPSGTEVEAQQDCDLLGPPSFNYLRLELALCGHFCMGDNFIAEQEPANEELPAALLERTLAPYEVIRIVNSLHIEPTGARLEVAPKSLSPQHPLANLREGEQGYQLTFNNGRVVRLMGKGRNANGLATAVMGDLLAHFRPIPTPVASEMVGA